MGVSADETSSSCSHSSVGGNASSMIDIHHNMFNSDVATVEPGPICVEGSAAEGDLGYPTNGHFHHSSLDHISFIEIMVSEGADISCYASS